MPRHVATPRCHAARRSQYSVAWNVWLQRTQRIDRRAVASSHLGVIAAGTRPARVRERNVQRAMAAMKSEKSTGEWTDENTIKLIEQYQTKTMLWDPKNDQYWKKDAKLEAWEEIGKALDTNSEICKNKMFSVLSSFRREKSKMKQSQGPGKGKAIATA